MIYGGVFLAPDLEIFLHRRSSDSIEKFKERLDHSICISKNFLRSFIGINDFNPDSMGEIFGIDYSYQISILQSSLVRIYRW